MLYANNKCADQPAHPRSLISAFVVRCLDSIISLVCISSLYIRNFKPVPSFFGCAGRFESYLIGNLEDRFSRDETHFILGGGGGGGGIDLGNPCNNDGECQAGGGGANSECSTNCICSTGYADNAGSCDRGNNIMHIYFRTNRFKY